MASQWINELRNNALDGEGPCEECPAFSDGRSSRVNPGLFNPDGELMFVTIEPSHSFDWEDYEEWDDYNDDISRKFIEEWTGGPVLQKLLTPIRGLDLESVWMADAIKCPPAGGVDNQTRDEEFNHCKIYLQDEIQHVSPDVIIGLGKNACLRTLTAFGVERQSISVSKECGRMYDTSPPVVISPHWSYGWLERETSDSWGDGWLHTQGHLDESYQRNMDVVRASIEAVRD